MLLAFHVTPKSRFPKGIQADVKVAQTFLLFCFVFKAVLDFKCAGDFDGNTLEYSGTGGGVLSF